MKNGKVRIYDLSKELSLENKDVLEICSQLSINVKTHSSTITEVEAQNIREVAKNYSMTSTPKQIKKSSQTQKKTVKKSQLSELKPKTKKPEIVALHKHNRPENFPEASGSGGQPQLLAPPPRPATPPTTDSEKNLTVATTEIEGISVLNQSEEAPQSTSLVASSNTITANTELKAPLEYSHRENSDPQPGKPAPTLPKPELIKPPHLPSKNSQETQSDTLVQDGEENKKPKPRQNREGNNQRKRNRNRQRGFVEKPSISTSGSESPQQRVKPVKKPQLSQEDSEYSSTTQPELKRPSKPELQKPPQRSIKLTEADLNLDDEIEEKTKSDSQDEDFDNEIVLLDKPKRLKQKQKKPAVAGKESNWEEDDSPAAKKTPKKRRPVIIDDEDDLEDYDDQDEENGDLVSLALARPQKQKTEQESPTPRSRDIKKQKPRLEKFEPKSTARVQAEKQTPPEFIVLKQSLNVRELADLLNTPDTEIIKILFFKGVAVNITETLDLEIAEMVAQDLGVEVITEEDKASAAKTEMLAEADLDKLQHRPPVVTIMGHVDHGKTTLLDSIRNTKVVQGEAGGITQHIGAYHVDVEHDGKTQQIVFLDTPGHEAFTAMRARGARVTDIAILVVAADDGVRPQTREAISHARAAKVPIVVAINKVDKPDANPDRVKQELMELELVPEDWGGDTIMVPVSALTGDNLDTLLEMLVLVSEIEELSANPDRLAKGTVIEANLDRARGPVATLLVQNGTLRVGDVIVAGSVAGKIRAMIDDQGDKVEEATPSFAVEVLGLSEVPAAGDEFDVYDSEKEARAIAEERAEEARTNRLQQAMSSRRVTLSSLSAQAQQGELKELNLILKADVQGSAEAILGSLKQLPQKEVQIRVLLSGAGEVTETDVDLAAASGAVVIGFNTTLAPGARQAAEQEGVDIREYNIIYKLLDEIEGAMEGLLDPEEVEESLGVAEVRAVFPVGKGAVAGCYVQSGKVVRNRFIRVLRDGKVVYDGNLDSLRRVKDDVKEVASGFECGIGIDKFAGWQEGDRIEAYEMVFKRRTLSQ